MLPTVEETRGYDYQDPLNVVKWRGLLVNHLRKVVENIHPTLSIEDSALQYVESLCIRVLALLTAVPSPLTVQDVEERVARTFPNPLHKWAIAECREMTSRKLKKDGDERPARSFPITLDRWANSDSREATRKIKKPIIPYDKLHHFLQKEVLLYKIDVSVSQFITAVLEFMGTDILRLAGNYVKKISQKSGYETITCRDIKTVMCVDKSVMDMFYQESDLVLSESSNSASERRGRRGSLSYAELVRDLLTDEKHFLRDLNLIIRVFKDELEKILDKDSRAISLIFGNIVDIYELTTTLLGNLEDAMEMSQDSPTPYIGSCFEELAEVEEFRAYVRYANIVTRKESREALQNIVDDPMLSERLDTAGHGFRLAVKYYLPKLLMAPVAHVFLYHNYVLALLQIAPASEDRESFKQVECNLHPIKKLLIKALGNGPKMDATLRMASRARRQLAIEKCNELARIVENWDVSDIGQCFNEFIREDTLSKIGPGKRIAERRAYLFDGLLLLCKPVTNIVVHNSSTSGHSSGGVQQLKLKEKLHIRKLELVDRTDTEEGRHIMELCPRVGPAVVLSCASCAEKRNWMCDLVMLNTKPMLDRFLDSILLDLERKHPLKLPPASLYRFAVPDSPDNIVLEDPSTTRHQGNANVPLIKGATLLKLVERLTFHIYADLNLMRTFLTTYRSFCLPSELLDLLIERFRIPEPSEVYDTPRTAESIESLASSDAEKLSKNTAREDWKRYRKEFQQPVKFRVINVLRHWVDQHFYDFEREPALLDKLKEFLESVDGKPMRKWVQSVLKTLMRKSLPPPESDNVSLSSTMSMASAITANTALSTNSASTMSVNSIISTNSNASTLMGNSTCASNSTLSANSGVSAMTSSTLLSSTMSLGSASISPGLSSGTLSSGTLSSGSMSSGSLSSPRAWYGRVEPPVLRHVAEPERVDWHPLALHPLEFARQLTLFEFELYKQVKPSELVGAVWTKKEKEKTSPNLLKIIKHTTNFTRWMEKWIVESENLDERVGVVCRLLDVCIALRHLNNFNGVLAVVAACGSASVHRLRHTFQMIPIRLVKALDEYRELNSDHFRRYQESLRSINPPCVPFFGMYLTNILHIEEGNLDYLPDSELINFSKRRKVAEITGEIQQYQNQPYCLTKEPKTRAFLETLDPFPGKDDNEITNYLYAKSLEIEPRFVKQMPKFPRRYPELSLKHVKVSRRAQAHHDSNSHEMDSISLSGSQTSPTGMTHHLDGSVQSLPLHFHDERGNKEVISPRLERCSLSQLSQLSLFDKGLALFDKNKPTNNNKSCSRDEPPSPRDRHSPRHDRSSSTCERKPAALSPRGAIVDAELFYSKSVEHLSCKKQDQESVPPLLPRGAEGGAPPAPPRRPATPPLPASSSCEPPPEPPDRPLPSPKHHDFKMPAVSPKRSPAPQPPASPLVHNDRGNTFKFDWRGAPTPSPPAPPSTPHQASVCGTPPPLPPRRRRDSTAPVTPRPATAAGGASPVLGGAGHSNTPPPLPPRPAPPPELLRPAHSTILQRRHHNSTAPRLPPKPPAPSAART